MRDRGMKQTNWCGSPHLLDAATWLLESAIVAARKGWSKQTGASHPRSQNSTKFQTGGDSITVVPQQYSASGGSGTKKGDRGYIRLIPRAATTPCVPLSPAIILRKSALYPWESLMLMILALSSTFYPFYPLNHHLTPERGLVFLRNLIWWEKNSTKGNTIIL